MTHCHVQGCHGPWRGQMLACPAHWSMLSEELRLALTEAHDIREAQEHRGVVTRDTRERWKTLVKAADEEWAAIEEELEAELARIASPEGRREGLLWARIRRRRADDAAAAQEEVPADA